MNGWMNVWMAEWMNEWMNGWMDGWMDVWMEGWLDGWLDGWMDGCREAWRRTNHMDCWMAGFWTPWTLPGWDLVGPGQMFLFQHFSLFPSMDFYIDFVGFCPHLELPFCIILGYVKVIRIHIDFPMIFEWISDEFWLNFWWFWHTFWHLRLAVFFMYGFLKEHQRRSRFGTFSFY